VDSRNRHRYRLLIYKAETDPVQFEFGVVGWQNSECSRRENHVRSVRKAPIAICLMDRVIQTSKFGLESENRVT
jgi:hypothetical protein